MILIAQVTKVLTNTKAENAFMKTEQDTQSMKNIKKISFDENLEFDKTGHKSGKAYLKRISEKLGTSEIKSYYIQFEKGAKSKIHLHDSDQIIFAIKGYAQLVTFSSIDTIDNKSAKLAVDKSINLEEGQAVLIPSGTLHWHGASKSKKSSQISIMKNGKTFWF